MEIVQELSGDTYKQERNVVWGFHHTWGQVVDQKERSGFYLPQVEMRRGSCWVSRSVPPQRTGPLPFHSWSSRLDLTRPRGCRCPAPPPGPAASWEPPGREDSLHETHLRTSHLSAAQKDVMKLQNTVSAALGSEVQNKNETFCSQGLILISVSEFGLWILLFLKLSQNKR